MEGLCCDQYYYEVIKNGDELDEDISRIVEYLSIEKCIKFKREGYIRFCVYQFNGEKFINLSDLIFLMVIVFITQESQLITITFENVCQLTFSILQTIHFYTQLFQLESILITNIWINCNQPFSGKNEKQIDFKIMITDILSYYKGNEVPISSTLLFKIKEIISRLFTPFFSDDTWIDIVEQSETIEEIIEFINIKIRKLTHYQSINYKFSPYFFGLACQWNSFKQLLNIFPQLISSILKQNIIHWIIKGNIIISQEQQDNLEKLLSVLKLEKLLMIKEFNQKKENAQKLKLYLIENEYLNSLENLRRFPNEEFEQWRKCLIQSEKTYLIESQKNQLLSQIQIFQHIFPLFYEIFIQKSQLLNLVEFNSLFEDKIPQLETNVIQFNKKVYQILNQHFKLQSFKSQEEFELELRSQVFKQIDQHLTQNNSIDEISQILSDENMLLQIVKDFYSKKVRELNQKTLEKIKFRTD